MFKEIKLEDLNFNFIKEVKKGALITAKAGDKFNTMTIGWLTLGVLWSKEVGYTYVRESRYTYQFMEKNDYYTVAFFDEDKASDISYLGRVSGRDEDKLAKTSLTPVIEGDLVYYKEAKVILVFKKLSERIIPSTNIPSEVLTKYYPTLDYHKEYIGEVVKVLIRNGE